MVTFISGLIVGAIGILVIAILMTLMGPLHTQPQQFLRCPRCGEPVPSRDEIETLYQIHRRGPAGVTVGPRQAPPQQPLLGHNHTDQS